MAAFTPASKYAFPYVGFLDGVAYSAIGAGSAVVNVSTSAQLTTALANAAPGQRIVLANGTYSGAFTLSSKVGSVTNGLSIEAATRGGAIFAGGSTLTVRDSAHITLSGLSFPYELSAASNTVQFRGSSHHCRITRCLFGPSSVGTPGPNKTPMIYGGDNVEFIRVDHNEFRNKANPGNTILFDGNFTSNQVVKHIRIDHNYLHDIRPEVTNEKEPIRFGVSSMSKSFSYSVIERNVLVGCICEPENISVKACGVRVSGNTVLRSIGGIVYRHGTNGLVSDNHIVDRVDTFGSTIGSGGIRFYDANHEIIFNYVDGVYGGNFQGPLTLDSGDAEGSSTALDAHWRVVNALVEGNVLVGNPEGVRFGHNYSLAPTGCKVQNNLVAQTPTGTAITQRIAPVNTTQTANLYGSTPPAIGLAQGSDTIWRRADYGPGTTYLQPADVGITGDPNDTDGTGVLVGSPVTPGDPTTAADVLGWGAPLPESDEFGYVGAPNSSKWNVYNGPGHGGNGRRLPARVTVDGAKLVGTGLANGDSFGMEQRLNQRFGRWEVRCRSYPTSSAGQTLGVGGVAVPGGAITGQGNAGSRLSITTSGTSTTQRVYDGGGRTVGGITITADYVTVQNFVIRGSARDGISSTGTGVVMQNNDIALVHDDGTGDINGITFFGDNTQILFNSIGQNAFLVEGNPNGSHTDGIQTWNTPSKRSSSNVLIKGNWITGPSISDARYLHQGITAEGNDATSGGGGGTGNSATWTIDGNYFNTAGNQVLELHDIQGVVVTRNTFAGNASKVVNSADGSTVTYYGDNIITGSYGSVGVSVTSGAGPGTSNNNYHPVLILWTDEVPWPIGGEIDFLENGAPGQSAPEAYWHYPHASSVPVQQIHFTGPAIDLSQWHNFAVEWTPDGLVGYVDGVEWCRASGGANSVRENIQDLRTAHLTIQLDNFDGTNQIPATMEVEWARVYSLVPSGSPAGPQTLPAVGIASRETFGIPSVTGTATPPANSVPTQLGQNLVLGTGTLGWTLTAGTPPAGSQTVRTVGIPTGATFGLPSFDVPAGDQTLSVTGIPPTETFGLPLVGALVGPPAAEGGVLVPALYAVGRDGVTLTPLPSWTKIHLSPVQNSAGSLSIEYPAGAPGFDLLQTEVSAAPLRALEIRVWLGGSNAASLGGWLVSKAGDDLTPGSSWSFDGHFHEWLLQKAIVAPQAISDANKSGALTFAGATAGLIFTTMMDQAQNRGALPLITRDFTSTHDSNGVPWANAISSLKLAPKTTLAQVADKLVTLGMVEYELTPARMWRAYNPGGRGVDRTTGASPLQFTPTINLRERARRVSSRDAGTAVLVAGAEGFYKFVSSPTAQAELGWRAEVGADAGQINSQSGVDAVAAAFLETARAGTAEYNSAVEFVPGQPLPLINYGVGDWAHVLAGTKYERLRIAQIELDFEQGRSPHGTVVQNDLITDRITALYRRLNAIATGDAVVGTSTSTPGGAGEDVNPPAAPEGVTVASTFAYQTPGQTVTLAEIGVGWAAVTTNAYASDEIAAKAKAAPLIAAKLAQRLLGGLAVEFEEDWSWIGMPPITDPVRLALLDEWNTSPTNDHGDENTRSQAAQTWLAQYATTHLGGGAITDDVAHYRVQFQYLGAQQVTTRGPRGEAPPDQLQPEGAWEEPINSPTTQTTIVFGNVEGGRAVGVRVAAVDRANNQGPWSVVVAVDSASDDQPPPTPSKPVATAWFRTMDVFWDGKGSAGEDMLLAAPDFASGGGIEVHVDTGIDFLPDRPVGPTGKVDLSTSRTYQQTLYAAGTWNVVGLTVGTTYYARFVAVDRSGNASEPSETSDGVLPQQLVQIDIGPNAIGHEQIIDAEIVRAKIADAAINSLKVEEINVGLLRSGTMSANVIIGGRFTTPTINGNKVEIDNAGIRLWQGNTVIGRWQVSDASMLVTGTYLSGLSGRRINILPSGTMIFYPDAGLNFGFIENLGGDLRMSGQFNQDNRAGYVLIDETRAALTYSQVATYNQPRTRFQVDPIAAATWAPIVSARINRSLDSDALGPRWLYTNFSTSGDIGTSIVHLQQVAAASNHAMMYGANSDAGIVFDSGFIAGVHNSVNPCDFHGSGFIQVSAVEAKRDIAPVQFGEVSARRLTQAARARSFYYAFDLEPRAERPGTMLRRFDEEGRDVDPVPGEWTHPPRRPVLHVGPMADELLAIAPEIVHTDLPRHGGLGLNMGTVAGLAYAAVGELADEHDALAAEVAALRKRLDHIDGSVVDGEVVEDE